MADFRDKMLGSIFPTHEGIAPGGATERTMLESVGGAAGIRTKIQTNPDGSETMLRTRGGMPEFTTTKKQESEIYDACQHGLFFGGIDYFDSDPAQDRMRTSGGALELDSGAVVALPGARPVTGDAFMFGNYTVSGKYSRVCGNEWGDFVWPITFSGVTYLCRHILGAGDLWIYALADKTFTTPLAQLTMPSLPAKLAGWTASLFDNSHSYAGTYYPFLVDIDSTGTKVLFEVHKLRNYGASGIDPFETPSEFNRVRLMRPSTLLYAWESVISYDGSFHIANADKVTYAIEQYQAGSVVYPTSASLLPLPNYQNHSWVVNASISGSLTINYYPQAGGGPNPYSLTAINGTAIASYQFPQVFDAKCYIGGLRYSDADEIEVAYTRDDTWQEITVGYTRGTATYHENGANDFSTPVFSEVVDNKRQVRQFIGATQLGIDQWSNEHFEFVGYAQGGPPFDMALIGDSGAYALTYGPFAFMVRLSNKIFGQVTSGDINWTDPNFSIPWPTTLTLGVCAGTALTKTANKVVFSGTAVVSTILRDTLFTLHYSMNPLMYASQRPDASKKIAIALDKSLCWV